MSLLGETGLRRLAALNHAKARRLAMAMGDIPGVRVLTRRFFNEIAIALPAPAATVVEILAGQGVIAGVPFSRLAPGAGMDEVLLLAATETVTDADIVALTTALKGVLA
jgi:glycine dehydrogenase subunit 1